MVSTPLPHIMTLQQSPSSSSSVVLSMPDSEPVFDTDDTWDTPSHAPVDDVQGTCCFGVPLTRMVKLEYLSSPSVQSTDLEDSEDSEYLVRAEEINHIEEDMSLFDLALSHRDDEDADENVFLRWPTHAYVHHVIDHMASHTQHLSSPRIYMHATPSHPSYPLIIRHLPSTSTYSRELALWRYLNEASLRRDPWNPSPPVISIIERGIHGPADDGEDEAYIVMDRMYHLQDNPMKCTGDWVDFVRQMLQGLVFLHEHNITQVSYPIADAASPPNIMMDIGLAPPQTHFSRAEFPVKYYLLDFSKAVIVRVSTVTWPPCPTQVSSWRGRTKSTVLLSSSRPRIPSVLSDSFVGSLVVDTPSVNLTFTLASARTRSDSDVTLVSQFNIPDLNSLNMDIPKQNHFFSQPSSPDRFSDPEVKSGSEDASSDEGEQKNVRVVHAATRALLFATDLKNLARVLESAVQSARPVSEALVPVFTAMRQARTLSLSAEDALRLFESAVRQLDMTDRCWRGLVPGSRTVSSGYTLS